MPRLTADSSAAQPSRRFGITAERQEAVMTIDQDKLGELLGTFVNDLGATVGAGNVVVGHRLGLYRGLADSPATPEQLAQRTGTDPRYVAEWLCGQAAGGYVSYDPATEQFSLTAEQAYALADPDGPLYLDRKSVV